MESPTAIQKIREALRPTRRILRDTKRKVLRRLGMLGETWEGGVPHELDFWEKALTNPDQYWIRSEYDARLNPDTELQPAVRDFIGAAPGATVRILDIGAGPLTRLGKRWQDRTVEIHPLDPLAEHYKEILARLRLTPPVFTETGEGEKLPPRFAKNSFDLSFASNSLDHSRDPLKAIQNMFDVAKPQGGVYLWHFAHVGVDEAYVGMHQWNFDLKGNDMLLSDGRGVCHSLAETFKGVAKLECETEQFFENTVLIAKLRKLVPT